jgi:hypothetical protein
MQESIMQESMKVQGTGKVNPRAQLDAHAETRSASHGVFTFWQTMVGKKILKAVIQALFRRHREPLLIPGVKQQPFHEHAEAETQHST